MFCLRIFNHFIYTGDYSAVIHQRILYVILPQITLITLIFLLLSLALSETMSQMTGCSFAQDYAD